MPGEWGILAARTATWAVEKTVNRAAIKEKAESAFKKSGLDRELARAYEAGFRGFVDVLRGPFDIDDVMDARLRVMFADDGFQDLLNELPRTRFADVDTKRPRELFAGLGLPGAGDAFFDVAWAAFGRHFQEAIAQTRHASRLVELSRQDRIDSYLKQIAEASALQRVESAELAAYRRYVNELYRLADTRGLFWREKETAGEEIRLDEIFVETLLRRQDGRLQGKDRRTEDDAEPLPDGPQRQIYRDIHEEPRAVADVLARERRLVILGLPGSGKSTLVRCLALAHAIPADDTFAEPPMRTGLPDETVPIILTLKTYAAHLKNHATLRLDDFLREQLGRLLPDLEVILASGHALVLLDGLDEVFDDDHRRWVSDEVGRLMNIYGKARFVLTSRPHGYRAAPLPGAVPLFEMVAFDEERIHKFFLGWFQALERQGLDVEYGRMAGQRAEELAKNVLGRPRIRALAENPMLCTLIVMVHRSRSGRIPQRRVDFYEAAVSVLTEHWEKYKRSPRQEGRFDYPEPKTMKGVLAEVAWRAQVELEGREIPTGALEEWMRSSLQDDPDWSAKRKGAVRDLLQVVQERTGLLSDAGGQRYQFVHLSLQEYLVAFYMLDRLDDGQCCRVIRHFVHAAEWEEILRLTIAAAPRTRADALVRAILEEPTSEWEEICRRDLRFVCRCMQDRPNVSDAVKGDIRSLWLRILEERSYDDEGALILDGVGLGLTSETRAAVEARLSDEDGFVRRAAVEYFAQIGADDERTHATFEQRLSDDNIRVRAATVSYFAKIAANDERTRAAVEVLLSDEDRIVRGAAVSYFAEIGATDERTRSVIERRLSDEDGTVRGTAVLYFTQVAADDEKTRAAVEALLSDEDFRVRVAAVLYFMQLGADDESTRTAFEASLSDEDERVRYSAIVYFAEISATDERTRTVIEACLSDEDAKVRSAAVRFFAQIGADDERTRTIVKARLSDEDGRVRGAAILYFAQIGADDERTRAIVEGHLSEEDESVRSAAILYFAQIGADDERTRSVIEAHLSDEDERVRRAVVEYFLRSGLGSQAVAVFNVFSSLPFDVSVSPEASQNLAMAIGRFAANDNAFLARITGERALHFQRSRMFAAVAGRRDEIHRSQISLADVLIEISQERSVAPLKLTRLEIYNFKNLESIEIDLHDCSHLGGDWTCIAGINGSGKTSILQAICLLLLGRRRATELGQERLARMLRRNGREHRNAELRATVLAGERQYRLVLPLNENGVDEKRIRELPYAQAQEMEHLWEQLGRQMLVSYGATRNLSDHRDTRYGGLSREARRQMTLFDPLIQVAAVDVLLEYDEEKRPVLTTLLKLLEVVLEDNDLGLTVTLDPNDGLVFRAEGCDLEAQDLPDGFRSLVAWLADLCATWHSLQKDKTEETSLEDVRGIVLLDEIDLHLHPALQRILVPRLRRALPNVQWIVTTHSPLVLASFEKEELVVLERDSEGGIRTLDRQILGFSVDQVYEWLMGTSPHSSVMDEKLERGDDDVAVLFYQAGGRDEAEAREALERRKERFARLEARKTPK